MMAHMSAYTHFRRHKRLLIYVAIFAYLGFAGMASGRNPTTFVLLVGAGILLVVFFYPSNAEGDPKPRRKFKKPRQPS
jgi:hypothetical protein